MATMCVLGSILTLIRLKKKSNVSPRKEKEIDLQSDEEKVEIQNDEHETSQEETESSITEEDSEENEKTLAMMKNKY